MAFSDYGNSFQKATPIVINLLIANVAVFIAQYIGNGFTAGTFIIDTFALHYYKSEVYQPWQLITHMFMHGSFLHILLNMYGLYMFGSIIERLWGPKKFLIFYFISGLGAALAQMAFYAYAFKDAGAAYLSPYEIELYREAMIKATVVGASGAIMGLLVAYGYLFPNTEMMIMPIPIPIKAKWLVIGIIALDLFSGFANRAGDNTAHFAHLGGALTGFLLVLYWNKTNKKTFY